MDITIFDLMSDKTELLLNSETVAPFAHVARRPSHFDDTFDICLTVHGICVSSHSIAFNFPSGLFEFFPIPSDNYLKIEVM